MICFPLQVNLVLRYIISVLCLADVQWRFFRRVSGADCRRTTTLRTIAKNCLEEQNYRCEIWQCSARLNITCQLNHEVGYADEIFEKVISKNTAEVVPSLRILCHATSIFMIFLHLILWNLVLSTIFLKSFVLT